jgi:hypothetical protein
MIEESLYDIAPFGLLVMICIASFANAFYVLDILSIAVAKSNNDEDYEQLID